MPGSVSQPSGPWHVHFLRVVVVAQLVQRARRAPLATGWPDGVSHNSDTVSDGENSETVHFEPGKRRFTVWLKL